MKRHVIVLQGTVAFAILTAYCIKDYKLVTLESLSRFTSNNAININNIKDRNSKNISNYRNNMSDIINNGPIFVSNNSEHKHSFNDVLGNIIDNIVDNINIIINNYNTNKIKNKTSNIISNRYINQKSEKRDIAIPKNKTDLPRLMKGMTCSTEVSALGPHQKIISYSFFGNETRYYSGLRAIVTSAKRMYSDFKVRIYTNSKGFAFLKPLMSDMGHVYICDSERLPPPLGNITAILGSLWRFAPIGDPQVDVVLVRDADSKILTREVSAVREWLRNSSKTLHVMRDHPQHGAWILAGMFGIRAKPINLGLLAAIRNVMFKTALNISTKFIDQDVLKNIMWPNLKNDSYCHDSYTCAIFPGSHPWPTKRRNGKFVGSPDYLIEEPILVPTTCPVKCRPKDHLDWEYC